MKSDVGFNIGNIRYYFYKYKSDIKFGIFKYFKVTRIRFYKYELMCYKLNLPHQNVKKI